MRVLVCLGLAGVLVTTAFGCEVRSPHDVQSDNPLGPSFWIVAVPGDDDSLLGRTFRTPPDTALSLDEQSAPNPCAEKLGPRVEAALPNHYENAIQTRDAEQARALFTSYGFQGNSDSSSQLLYKIDTTRKVLRFDTTEYQACCREHDCGWGYVQALVYGQGEYAAGTEVNASAEGNYSVVRGEAKLWFKVKDTRSVKGYLAALLVAHDRSQAVQACPPSMVWAKTECLTPSELTDHEELCAHGVPEAKDPMWKDSPQMQAIFQERQAGACSWLEEHGRPLPP